MFLMFFVVQVVLGLTLQATLREKIQENSVLTQVTVKAQFMMNYCHCTKNEVSAVSCGCGHIY